MFSAVYRSLHCFPFRRKLALVWRLLIFLMLSLGGFKSAVAQEAVVSSYFNAADPRDEWTEILVIQDNLNLGGWYLHDNNSAQQDWQDSIVFKPIAFWDNMRAGTIIMIWHRATSTTSAPHPIEVNKNDGYIELDASNLAYFTGGVFTGMNNTLNIATSGDIVEIKKPGYLHVHSLSHKTGIDSCYTNMPPPKLNHQSNVATGEAVYVFPGSNPSDYGTPAQNGTTYTQKSNTDLTFGLPNNSASNINSDFWRSTRQPSWNTPNLTLTPNGTQVILLWNQCVDPYVTDGTQGYIILRNTTNSFTAPTDGINYSISSTIGSATVIATITSSLTTTYTDNISLNCGEEMFYRIYAYRYTIDNGGINSIARGRAYNETDFASASVTATNPAAPTIPVDTINVCEGNPVTLTASGCSGTIDWSNGGTGTPYTFTPTATATYTATCTVSGCVSAASLPVTVNVSPSPVIATVVPANPTSCVVNDGTITLTGLLANTSYALNYLFNGSPVVTSNVTTNSSGNLVITGLSSGSYTGIIVTINGCSSAPVTTNLADPGAPSPPMISAPDTTICPGQSVTLTATGCTGTVTWNTGVIGSTLTVSPPTTTPYTATCTVSGCVSTASNQLTITVSPSPVTPPISSQGVTGNSQEVCLNSLVPYAIDPPTPGSVYSWNLSGAGSIIILDPPIASLININWTNVGSYILSVTETSADGCTGITVTLNVTVNSPSTASISIQPVNTTICSGQPVTYTATPENGGTSPEYTWYVNNIPEPSSNTPVFTYTSNNPYTIYAALNSSSPCAIPNPVYSDTITMSVLQVVSPYVSITADINTVCEGTPITFTAEILNGGNAPVYQWKKNGDDAGTNDSTFTGIFNNNDLISCVITSNALCASPPTVTSNEVIVVIKPAPSVTGTTQSNPTTCGGTDGTISLEGLIPGNSYLVNFSFNGTPVPTKYINTNSSGILTITGLRAGNYSGIIVTFNGCSSLPVIANLNDPGATSAPTVNNNFYSICQGDSVEISVTGCGGTVKWSNGANNSATYVSPNVTFSYTATCEVNGCISAPSDPIEVFVNVKPLISIQTITNPSTWCVDDGVITLTGLLPGEVYTIRFNDGSIADSIIGSSSPTGLFEITGCAPTTYFNISAEHNDCRSENIVAIVGDPVSPTVPMITANEDTICPGQTVVLTATGCSGIVTWDDGSQGTTLTVSPGATNSFKATCTENSCISAYSIPVTVTVEDSDIAAIEGDKNYCVDGQILLNAVGDAITYQWILPDGTSEFIQNFEKGNISLNDSGFYVLSTMDLLGCSDRDSIEISVNLAPVISIAPADTLCAGIQYMLSPGEGYPSYLWHDGSTLSSFPAFDEGGYWVQVTDTNGCAVTSSVWLTYCPQDVYIPNAFSPDRNGINEFFVPVTGGNVLLDYYMIIYNRWGQKVFESYDYHTGWNGTLNGNDSPSGLYTYLIMYKISDPKSQVTGELQKIRGTVTLLR